MARLTAPAHTTALPTISARSLISLAFMFRPLLHPSRVSTAPLPTRSVVERPLFPFHGTGFQGTSSSQVGYMMLTSASPTHFRLPTVAIGIYMGYTFVSPAYVNRRTRTRGTDRPLGAVTDSLQRNTETPSGRSPRLGTATAHGAPSARVPGQPVAAPCGVGSVGGKPDSWLAAGGRPPLSPKARCTGGSGPAGSGSRRDGHHRRRTTPAIDHLDTGEAMPRQRAHPAGGIPTSPGNLAHGLSPPGPTTPRPPRSALGTSLPQHRHRHRAPLGVHPPRQLRRRAQEDVWRNTAASPARRTDYLLMRTSPGCRFDCQSLCCVAGAPT
jgi:hypothetical protein